MRADRARRIQVFLDDSGSRATDGSITIASLRKQNGVAAIITPLSDLDGDPDAVVAILRSTEERLFAWVDAGAVLAPQALSRMIDVAERFTAELVYADRSARIHGRLQLIARPDFSPLRFLGQDYLGDVVLVDALQAIESGIPRGLGRAVVDKVVLRLDPAKVVHVPEVLSRRTGPSPHLDTTARAERVLARLVGDGAGVVGVPTVTPTGSNALRVKFAPDGEPLVSIVIPTRGSSAEIRGDQRTLVVDAVRSILNTSSYRHLEIVVVADDATPQWVVDELGALAGDRLVLVRWPEPFNFSAKVNRGAAHAAGEFLLVLNDDIEVITPDWIETMLGLAQQPGIGAVGAHLVFEDGSVQHGGHFYQAQGAGHIALDWSIDDDDATGALAVAHEVSGVTGACVLVSAALFARAGGFSSLLPGNYNDVDFSMKIRALGERIVWTPWAKLFHFESKTRNATSTESEFQVLRARWGTRMEVDPYWPDGAQPVG